MAKRKPEDPPAGSPAWMSTFSDSLKGISLESLEVAVVKLGVPDIEFHMGLSFLFRYPALDKVGNEVY